MPKDGLLYLLGRSRVLFSCPVLLSYMAASAAVESAERLPLVVAVLQDSLDFAARGWLTARWSSRDVQACHRSLSKGKPLVKCD